jgi:hypothetical protein
VSASIPKEAASDRRPSAYLDLAKSKLFTPTDYYREMVGGYSQQLTPGGTRLWPMMLDETT